MWGDCVLTSCYLINRTFTPLLGGKSPYEISFGSKPNYSLLKFFSCYALLLLFLNLQINFPSVKEVFLEYPYAKKGYKVLNLETRQVFISRDVTFFENEFPFQKIVSHLPPNVTHIFPNNSPSFVDTDPITHYPVPLSNQSTSTESYSPSNSNNSLHSPSFTSQSLVIPTVPRAVATRPQKQETHSCQIQRLHQPSISYMSIFTYQSMCDI